MAFASVDEMKRAMEQKKKAREEFCKLREKIAPYCDPPGSGIVRDDAPEDIKKAAKRKKYLWKRYLSWH